MRRSAAAAGLGLSLLLLLLLLLAGAPAAQGAAAGSLSAAPGISLADTRAAALGRDAASIAQAQVVPEADGLTYAPALVGSLQACGPRGAAPSDALGAGSAGAASSDALAAVRALCGASAAAAAPAGPAGAVYVFVAATDADAVSIIDVSRPTRPLLAGWIADPVALPAPVSVWPLAPDAAGQLPVSLLLVASSGRDDVSGGGTLALLDVGAGAWRVDGRGRVRADPAVLSALTDCQRSSDPTFPRLYGRLCGPRAVVAEPSGTYAYVISTTTFTLSTVQLPAYAGPATGPLVMLGSLAHPLLAAPRALAAPGDGYVYVATAAGAAAGGTLAQVDVSDPTAPALAGVLSAAEARAVPGDLPAMMRARPLYGFERVAYDRAGPGAPYAYLLSPDPGRISVVRRDCADAAAAAAAADGVSSVPGAWPAERCAGASWPGGVAVGAADAGAGATHVYAAQTDSAGVWD